MIPSELIGAAQRALGSLITAIQNRWRRAVASRHVMATQLDPLLKAADELQGKLRSHAEEDFHDFREIQSTAE